MSQIGNERLHAHIWAQFFIRVRSSPPPLHSALPTFRAGLLSTYFMSRLIVKNLPAYLTQERLRKHFEASDGPGGTLTDVKLVLKPDGTSRRFGFIGYKSPQEAERAKKWFNRSFVDSSRITVDIVDVRLLPVLSLFLFS